MINHEYKYFFLHIEKCGGNTVRSALDLPYEKTGDHFPLKYKLKNFKHNPKEYFKFTFVRNPWSRMVSGYFYSYRKQPIKPSFKEYVTMLLHRPVSKGWETHMSCWDYIFDENATTTIDFIGKIENFEEDFNTVCDKIGISRRQLPHKNKSKHKHYTEYYDDETREIVAKKYAKDIEYFGYKFGS